LVALSPLYYEFPKQIGVNDGTMVVTFEDDKIQYHKFGLFIWEWSSGYANLPLYTSRVFSHVTPITKNPKSRKIFYRLDVKVSSAKTYFSKTYRRSLITVHPMTASLDDDIRNTVEYHLYDFNDQFSSKLAEFYNPLREEQQEEFRRLVIKWVNERLKEDGLEAVDGSFSIA